jgi:hypothetical protein
MKRTRRKKRLLRNSRGSALLVSLMVIVGLSLLGLGFVAISETETAIARNQQSMMQTQAIAEAGAKLVVEWFQDPIWGQTTGGLPSNDGSVNTNLAAIKTSRVSGPDSGVYRPSAQMRLLDKPYRPMFINRFYGDENSADLIINRTTDVTTIDAVNNVLLGPNAEDKRDGEVTEVKIYAPPIVGGTLTANGTIKNADGTQQKFWVGGQRFGVATIKVTATLFRDRTLTGTAKMAQSNILSTHAIRLVVGELPLPIPGGPIQSNTSIAFGGDFIVHWGNETSTGTLDNKRNPSAIPWANAYERPHFEHGYETGRSITKIIVTNGGTGYTSVPNVLFSAGAQTASATVAGGLVTAITLTSPFVTTYTTSTTPTITFTGGGGGTGATATAVVGAETWPAWSTAGTYDRDLFFNELLNKTFEDPWFGSRSVGDNLADGTGPALNGNPQCYKYSVSSDEDSASNASYFFQWQTVNVFPDFKKVLFPSIKYDFWKKIASQSRGLKGIYYFSFDKTAGSGYKKGGTGTTQPMAYWANSLTAGPGAKLGPGVYFFDTRDGVNPQGLAGAARTAQLTPAESWNSSDFGGSFLMEGFVYANNTDWGTKGMGSSATTVKANFPGEPYRDIGYPKWLTATSVWDTSCGGICRVGAGDGSFSYQDLNGNGKFDVVTMAAPAWTSYDPGATAHAAGATYVPKVWKSAAQAVLDYGAACTVPNGTTYLATDCSEPHEPYLNLLYTNSSGSSIKIGWEANGAQTFLKKNTGVTCSASSSQDDCTSNAYDLDGAQTDLDVILDGIFYNEGGYGSTGNASYYGSLLIQGSVSGNGTPDIWFDEKLIKGSWAPPNMPRVIMYNVQTDEEQ